MRNRKLRPTIEHLENIDAPSMYVVPTPLPIGQIQKQPAPPQAPAPIQLWPILFANQALQQHATTV